MCETAWSSRHRIRNGPYSEGMAYIIKGVEPTAIPALAELEKKIGAGNSLRVMAHRPEAMRHFTGLYEALMGPTALLDRRLREMIGLAVSHLNESSYGSAHHAEAALAAGLTGAEIREVEVENDDRFSPKERAALEYARELTRQGMVGDGPRYRAQEYFSDDEFVELTMIVGLVNFTNRFDNGLAVPTEE